MFRFSTSSWLWRRAEEFSCGRASRLEMQEILTCTSTLLRQEERQAEALDNTRRLQAMLDWAAEVFAPFPRGTERSPPPPTYDPLLWSDSTPLRPNAPVSRWSCKRRSRIASCARKGCHSSRTDGDCYESLPEPEQVHVYSNSNDSSVGRRSE